MSNGEDEVSRGVGWGCGPAAWVNERIVNVRTLNSSTVLYVCVCVYMWYFCNFLIPVRF